MDENPEEYSPFLDLPEEMFLHICSFLDVKDIVLSLSRVCKQFYYILRSDNLWRSWISARWGRLYPLYELREEDSVNWKEVCYALSREEQTWQCWTNGSKNMVKVARVVDADVDDVLMYDSGSKCATASRDRQIVLWDVDRRDQDIPNPQQVCKKSAHDGWVWRLKKRNNMLYSSSWDCSLKMWDMATELTELQQFKCNSAVLSLNVDSDGCVYGGCFKGTYVFDPRSGVSTKLDVVDSPKLTLDISGDDVLLGSEHHRIIVWNKKTQSVRQTLLMAFDNYPMCAQMENNVLYVGDRLGNVRLYKQVNGEWSEVAVVHIKGDKITAIRVTTGSIFTGANKRISAFLPLKPILPMVENWSENLICGMDVSHGVVVVGTASSIEFHYQRP